MMILLAILVFIIILGLLVFVHELGHFIMAKRAGMKVEEFGFGFPPRMFGIRRGETIYSINWIPLGGFVKILGEDGSDSQNPESFGNKSFWQRFFVLIAGVSMNVILSWVLISIGMGIGLPTVLSEGDQLPAGAHVRNQTVGILEVQDKTPAALAGLKAGDSILEINGQPVTSIEDAQSKTLADAGKPTTYTIKRGSDIFDKKITPRVNPPVGEGALGIALGSVAYVSYPWYQAPFRGAAATLDLIILTLTAFGSIIGQLLQGHPVTAALSGPVGIAVLTKDVTALGFIYVLQFAAVLSANLAIINAVPFPALDGGRVLFLIIEKIRGRKLDVRAETWANTVGFILLILLMVAVTVKDVGHYGTQFKNLFHRIF
jgi:regulator of sigma E protease